MTTTTRVTSIYARVSTPEQAGPDKSSLGNQIELCEHLCAENGWPIAQVIQEVGSAQTLERPEFLAMFEYIGEHEAQEHRILSMDITRLTRSRESGVFIMSMGSLLDIDYALVRPEFTKPEAAKLAWESALLEDPTRSIFRTIASSPTGCFEGFQYLRDMGFSFDDLNPDTLREQQIQKTERTAKRRAAKQRDAVHSLIRLLVQDRIEEDEFIRRRARLED